MTMRESFAGVATNHEPVQYSKPLAISSRLLNASCARRNETAHPYVLMSATPTSACLL
jgi:hypothetical protein